MLREAGIESEKALAEKRKAQTADINAINKARASGDSKAELKALNLYRQSIKTELDSYKSDYGGYIDHPRVKILLQELDAVKMRTDELTGKEVNMEIGEFTKGVEKMEKIMSK